MAAHGGDGGGGADDDGRDAAARALTLRGFVCRQARSGILLRQRSAASRKRRRQSRRASASNCGLLVFLKRIEVAAAVVGVTAGGKFCGAQVKTKKRAAKQLRRSALGAAPSANAATDVPLPFEAAVRRRPRKRSSAATDARAAAAAARVPRTAKAPRSGKRNKRDDQTKKEGEGSMRREEKTSAATRRRGRLFAVERVLRKSLLRLLAPS